jgi:hypothetical protein
MRCRIPEHDSVSYIFISFSVVTFFVRNYIFIFLFVQIAIRKLILYIFPIGYCADGTLFI